MVAFLQDQIFEMMGETMRDARHDLLRGFFLAVMMINHLPPFPKWAWTLSVDSYGFFSGTSGFIFISGYLAGETYGRTIERFGLARAVSRSVIRFLEIYAMHMACYLALWLMAQSFSSPPRLWLRTMPLFFDDPILALRDGALLRYRPPFLNILPIFMLFALATPWLVAACRRGWGWAVITSSLLFWAIAQPTILGTHAVSLNALTGPYDLLGWQPIFVLAVVMSSRRPPAPVATRRTPIPGRTMDTLNGTTLAVAFCAACLVARWSLQFTVSNYDAAIWTEPWISKGVNGPLRLVNFLAAVYIVSAVPHATIERWAGTLAGRFVAMLGQHSLQVFGWSVIVTFLAMLAAPAYVRGPDALALTVTVVCVLSLAIPCQLHARWRSWRDRSSSKSVVAT